MDFNKLRYLMALAELKSFSKAAEACYISQPALTRCIQSIEEEIGLKLFDRSRSPICLTYAGERYLSGMEEILAMKVKLDQEMAEIASRKCDRLTLGVPTTRSATWIPRVLPVFYQEYPNIEVQIVEGNSMSIEKMVQNESINLYFCATNPGFSNDFTFVSAFREEMMLVVSRQAKALARYQLPPNKPGTLQYIPPKLLNEILFCSATPAQGTYYLAHRFFDQYELHPEVLMEMVNTSAAYQIAPRVKAFAFAPAAVSQEETFSPDPIFCSPTRKPLYRELGVLYKNSRKCTPAAEAFLRIAKRELAHYAKEHNKPFEVREDIRWE